MEQSFCTEQEAIDAIRSVCQQSGHDHPVVIVARREQPDTGYRRRVTILVRSRENDELLVTNLNKASVQNHRRFVYTGSEIDLRNENLVVDYHYLACYVTPNLT